MNRLSTKKQNTIEMEDTHFDERKQHEKRQGGRRCKVCSEKTGKFAVTTGVKVKEHCVERRAGRWRQEREIGASQ